MIHITSPEEWRDYFGQHSRPPMELFEPPLVIPIQSVDVIARSIAEPAAVIDTRALDPSLYRVEADHYEPEPWEDEE